MAVDKDIFGYFKQTVGSIDFKFCGMTFFVSPSKGEEKERKERKGRKGERRERREKKEREKRRRGKNL